MVFTPVFFFDSDGVFSPSESAGAWVVFGSSLAAGPFEASVLDLLFFFVIFFVFRNDEGSGLVAPPKGQRETGLETGVEPPPPPPPPPPAAPPRALPDVDAATEADDDGGEDEVDEEGGAPRSRLHSSLWPARHAARWQAWLQYFR